MIVDFMQALRDIGKEKKIPPAVLEQIIKDALISAYRKHHGATGEIQVEVDWEENSWALYVRKEVVEVVEDTNRQMSLEEATVLDDSLQLGDALDIEVKFETFGRIAAQTAKQVMVQRIREAERNQVFNEYHDRVGSIITGTISRREGRTIYVNLGSTEGILPVTEQMATDQYRPNERLKFFIVEVKPSPKQPHVLLSRSHPGLLTKLFELEVPEIAEGVVHIESVAREAGYRSKVAVSTRHDNVDPVGACVGQRGSRVQAVVDELKGEKIDIVRYSEDLSRYIASALSPAKISEVRIDEDDQGATIIVPDNQQSLAIGKEGQNVRLAARLTKKRIDIRSESQIAESDAVEHPEFIGEGNDSDEVSETIESTEVTEVNETIENSEIIEKIEE
ncbi:MAG: transcription termination factor NusA [bacterium]